MFGSAYSLLALGFSLVFGIMKKINLAYGSSLLLAGACSVWVQEMAGFSVTGLFITIISASILINFYVERICFAPHRGQSGAIASIIASFAIWMQLDEMAFHLLPDRTHSFSSLNLDILQFGEILVRGDQLIHLAIAFTVMILLYFLIMKTNFGLLLRAASENSETASILGTRVALLGTATFMLAGFLGGVASFLILSSDSQITPLFGLWCTFKGLVAMMLGGVGSLLGAVIGGLLLGFIEAHVTFYLGAEFRDIITFGILFAVLVIKPGGIFGGNEIQLYNDLERRL